MFEAKGSKTSKSIIKTIPSRGEARQERGIDSRESSAPQILIDKAGQASGTISPSDVLHLQKKIGNLKTAQLLQQTGSLFPNQDLMPVQEASREKSFNQSGLRTAAGEGRQAKNPTGLPGLLKTGIERLSGIFMGDVRVHYNSPQPAKLEAHAYTRGNDIHVSPGQETHIAHEAWHVVQQKTGRVSPTRQTGGLKLNDDDGLEGEAEEMGNRAARMNPELSSSPGELKRINRPSDIVQGVFTNRGKPAANTHTTIAAMFKDHPDLEGIMAEYDAISSDPGSRVEFGDWLKGHLAGTGHPADDPVAQTVVRNINLGVYDRPDDPAHPGTDLVPATTSSSPSSGGPVPPSEARLRTGFTPATSAKPDELELLQKSLEDVRVERKAEKNRFTRDSLQPLATFPPPARKNIVFDQFKQRVFDPFRDIPSHLPARPGFSDGRLKLEGGGPSGPSVSGGDGHPVAQLGMGSAAFFPFARGMGGRQCLIKSGSDAKQYVADDHGVPTRRFAYMEKGYHQFMQFLGTGSMEGRNQMFHRAMGEVPQLLKPGGASAKQIVKGQVPPQYDDAQLAVCHQMMGNGPQQRGLSLTSTPRADMCYGNEAESFRGEHGVRMRLDLSRIPAMVKLLNHYCSEGVVDHLDSVKEEVRGTNPTRRYDYAGSVRKNRELFLEHLHPDWIDGVEIHDQPEEMEAQQRAGVVDVFDQNEGVIRRREGESSIEMMERMKRAMGYQQYAASYSAAIGGAPPPPGTEPLSTRKGYEAGQSYMEGYQIGQAAASRNAKPLTFQDLAAAFMQDEKTKKASGQKRMPDLSWVGWGHGSQGGPPKPTMDDPEFFQARH